MLKNRTPEIQFEAPPTIKKFQEQQLQQQLAYLHAKSPFYKRLFSEHKIEPAKIKLLDDLKHIPVTTKKDIQLQSTDFLCINKHEVVDYVTTSGTLGNPVTFMLSKNDINRLAYNEYLTYSLAGCKPGEVLQLMTTIDRMFMAGLAYYLGAQAYGMGVIRVGNGIPQLQWSTINSIHPTTAICVPSFLIKLAEYAEENGIALQSSLKKVICIGEPLRTDGFELNTLGQRIADKWAGLQLFSTYASTEMQSAFTECEHGKGGHLQPELIVVELLDENDKPVQEGELGEVTITTLGVEAMPLLRFKTGDICRMHTNTCACGRNTLRLSPILGRKGQMIKFKGTTLYPPSLFDVLDKINGVHNYIIEAYTNDIGTDELLVRVGSDRRGDEFEKVIKDSFRSTVRVAPTVVFENIEYISQLQQPATSRKLIKFIDRRKITN